MENLVNRRNAISSLGGGLGAAALGSLLSSEVYAQQDGLHHRPKIKRVIQLFMNGGAFQGDFFDPKPKLNEFAGQAAGGSGVADGAQDGRTFGMSFQVQ